MKLYLFALLIMLCTCVYSQDDDSCTVSIVCNKDLSVNSTQSVKFLLTADATGLNKYEWSTGDTTASIYVTVNPNTQKTISVTTYRLTEKNLVVNGNFAQGDSAFTTDFKYAGYHEDEKFGWYSIVDSVKQAYPKFYNCTNTGSEDNKFMVCKGSDKTEMLVFGQEINVKPSQMYNFHFVATSPSSPEDGNTVPTVDLQLKINSEEIGPKNSTSWTPCVWKYFNIPWTSGPQDNKIKLELYSLDPNKKGVEFAVDDIYLFEYCKATASVTLSVYINKDTTYLSGCKKDFPLSYGGNEYDKPGTYHVIENGSDHVIDVSEYPSYDYTIEDYIEEGQTYNSYNFNVSDSGTYVQYLTTVNGCDSIVRLHLSLFNEQNIWIPNAFTPQGNTTNLFEYKVTNKDDFILIAFEIFNRQGTRVFYTTQKDEFWDGTFNGELLPSGVYKYRLRYRCNTSGLDICEKRGDCILLK